MSDASAPSDGERVQRLVEVLDYLSAGVFVESMVTVSIAGQDGLAELEGRVNAFSKEYIRATIESDKRLAMIRSQNEAIARLSTPVLDVWDGVVLVPIIGAMDEARAADLTVSLLEAIVGKSAHTAIVDLTGAQVADGDAVEPLLRLMEAARLLGCQMVVSGIRPALASRLAQTGGSIGHAKIAGQLKDALRMSIADSLRRRKT